MLLTSYVDVILASILTISGNIFSELLSLFCTKDGCVRHINYYDD